MTDEIKELIWDMRGEQVLVECARCGKMVEIENATPEEAGEWECLPCNRIHDRIEALENKLERIRAVAEDRNTHGEQGTVGGYALILQIIDPPSREDKP